MQINTDIFTCEDQMPRLKKKIIKKSAGGQQCKNPHPADRKEEKAEEECSWCIKTTYCQLGCEDSLCIFMGSSKFSDAVDKAGSHALRNNWR